MQEFNFNQRTQFKVKWGGKDYVCQRPSQKMVVEFGEEVQKLGEDSKKVVTLSRKFLSDCGLPQEVYDELEVEQVKQLMNFISAKKN